MSNYARWELAYLRLESLLSRTERQIGPVANLVIESWCESALYMAQADECLRESERARALDIEPDQASAARRRGLRYNDRCLQTLDKQLPEAVERLRRDTADTPLHDMSAPLTAFQDSVLDQLLELDLRGDQAGAVGRQVRFAVTTANESGLPGLCDLLLQHGDELKTLRRRRAEHNDPATTIAAAGMAVLAGIIFAVCTAQNGGAPCSDGVAIACAVALFGMAVAIMFTQFLAIGGAFFA